MSDHDAKVIQPVKNWVESVVAGLNLCPFAKREISRNSIRYTVCADADERAVLSNLSAELELLRANNAIETTVVILENALRSFERYNQFLQYADELLDDKDLDGVFQIASFHPNYQFEGTEADDAENYSNRSPYPLLHILREASLDKVIDEFPDTATIPDNNIRRLRELGTDKMQAMLEACFN